MKKVYVLLTLFSVLALPHLALTEAPASVTPLLKPFVEKHEVAGAVALVADRDKVLSVETVGFSDIAKNLAMKPDAMFWIASQSKAMTAVAVMMLVDEGKIAREVF